MADRVVPQPSPSTISWNERSTRDKLIIVLMILLTFTVILNLVGLIVFVCVFSRHEHNVWVEHVEGRHHVGI